MVEDDISGSKRECLSSSGHNVMTAGSVESAIGLIKQNHFDIIFLDLSMPKRDGLQILKDISLIDPNSTIVIISARPEEQLPGEITEAGAYNIIKKPFSVDQIQEAVAKVLGAEAMSS
jgi:DNA-binding NtrC family response regulator